LTEKDKKLKILFISPIFYPAEGFGGPVTNTLELAKGLSRYANVTVCTSNAKNFSEQMNINEKKINENFNIIYFQTTSRRFQQFVTPKMKYFLKQNLEKYDLVHLHCYRQYQDYIFWGVNKYIKKPYFITMHGAIVPMGEKSILKKIYDICIGRKILKNAKKIIVLSELQKREASLMGVNKNKIIEIPFGIEKNNKHPKSSNFNLDHNKKYILYLGRIHKSKGIDDLILAFKKISDERIILLIVGSDYGFLNECKELTKKHGLENRIKFLGTVDHSHLSEIFEISKVLILPSKYEATGTVALEAASYGVPVILSDKCGLAEEFRKRKAAKVVSTTNVNELKNAIEWIFKNPEDVKVMKNNGHVYAQSLTWENTIKMHLKAYETM